MWGKVRGDCWSCKLSSKGHAKGQVVQKQGECWDFYTIHTNKVLTKASSWCLWEFHKKERLIYFTYFCDTLLCNEYKNSNWPLYWSRMSMFTFQAFVYLRVLSSDTRIKLKRRWHLAESAAFYLCEIITAKKEFPFSALLFLKKRFVIFMFHFKMTWL